MSKRRVFFWVAFVILLWPSWLVVHGGNPKFLTLYDAGWSIFLAAMWASFVSLAFTSRWSKDSQPPPPHP